MRIGTCGWGYLRPKDFGIEEYSSILQAYSLLFDCVEVNYTFYRIPRINTAKKWRDSVPENFTFTVKAYKGITHENKFKDVDEYVEKTLEIAKTLRAPIVLFQTPRRFKQNRENETRVLDFLSTLPKDIKYALELRGWSWTDAFAEYIWVVDPFATEPPEQDTYYFRLHGRPPGKQMYRYRYSDEDLKNLKEMLLQLNGEILVFFNNVWMYEDALRFKEMVMNERR